eukprot:526483-Pelagomonas_calceolata.AAC.1
MPTQCFTSTGIVSCVWHSHLNFTVSRRPKLVAKLFSLSPRCRYSGANKHAAFLEKRRRKGYIAVPAYKGSLAKTKQCLWSNYMGFTLVNLQPEYLADQSL